MNINCKKKDSGGLGIPNVKEDFNLRLMGSSCNKKDTATTTTLLEVTKFGLNWLATIWVKKSPFGMEAYCTNLVTE